MLRSLYWTSLHTELYLVSCQVPDLAEKHLNDIVSDFVPHMIALPNVTLAALVRKTTLTQQISTFTERNQHLKFKRAACHGSCC